MRSQSPQPQAPQGGVKMVMKMPPNAVGPNGKMMLSMPHGAMPQSGSASIASTGPKKMMMAPPWGSQVLGKSMMSTASSAHAGSMMAPGPGKKMMAMPPNAGMMKMKVMPPSSAGPGLGKSMSASTVSQAPLPAHTGPGGTPAFAMVNGKKMMLPPGARVMPAPGPMMAKTAMGNPAMRAGSPPAAAGASQRHASPQPQAAAPQALSSSESQARRQQPQPMEDGKKKKRNSLFSFLRVGSSSDEEDARPHAGAPSPAQPSPVKMAMAPGNLQHQKMASAPSGAGAAVNATAGGGSIGPVAPAGMQMKKVMMAGPSPAAGTTGATQPASILQKRLMGPAAGGPSSSSSLTTGAPPASAGVKFISMPNVTSNAYGGSASLASSMVNTAQARHAFSAAAAAPHSQTPEVDAASDSVMHSTTSLERMAAAAAAATAQAAGGSGRGGAVSPPAPSPGLRVASSTTLGGDAAAALQSAGIAGGERSTAKSPVARVSGRFASLTVADSDSDSSAEAGDEPAAPESHASAPGSAAASPRTPTPQERAGAPEVAEALGDDEAADGGSASREEDDKKANGSAEDGLAGSGHSAGGLARSFSTKVSLPSGAASTQPPHTRQTSRDITGAANKPTTPPPPRARSKQSVPTPLRSRTTPVRRPTPQKNTTAVAGPARRTTAATTSAKRSTAIALAASPRQKQAKSPAAAHQRQPSASTLGGGSDNDDDDDGGSHTNKDDTTPPTAPTEPANDITVSDEESTDVSVADSAADKKEKGRAERAAKAKSRQRRQHKSAAVKHSDVDDDDDSDASRFFDDDDADGGDDDDEYGELKGRDIYRLFHLLKREEAREAGGARNRSTSRTRDHERRRRRSGSRGGSRRALREPDAWDRLGGASDARQREPYAVHLHSTREIIGSPGIPWRYTSRHTANEPFPDPPSVSRPLGVINVGGGRYATLRASGTTSPYALPRTSLRPRSRSADAVVGGRSGGEASAPRDLYTSSILDDLTRDTVRAAQVSPLGLSVAGGAHTRRGLSSSSLSVMAGAEDGHRYCASPPRPLLSSIPIANGASPLRAVGLTANSRGGGVGDGSGNTVVETSATQLARHTSPSFFDAHRQMYFNTTGTGGSSHAGTPVREDGHGTRPRVGSRLRDRILVSPHREDPPSALPDPPPSVGKPAVVHGYRDSPLLLRPSSVGSSSVRRGGGQRSSALRGPQSASAAASRTCEDPPALIPHAATKPAAPETRSTVSVTRSQSAQASRKGPAARLTADAINRLSTPPRRSVSAPRSYQEFARRGQRRADGPQSSRPSTHLPSPVARRCSAWVDEVLSCLSENGRGAETRTPIQIPLVDLRAEFKPAILHDGDDDTTRRQKLDHVFGTDDATRGFVGSRPRAHVPGISFKTMTGVRSQAASPAPSAASHAERTAAASSTAVVLNNLPPKEGLPFEQYSTVKVKDPQRPSAWALTPERDAELCGVLPGQPAVRRVVRRADPGSTEGGGGGDHGQSDGDGPYDTVEEIHLDEFKRPYVVIKRVPRGAAAQRQLEAAKRLSIPKRRYVRAGEEAEA